MYQTSLLQQEEGKEGLLSAPVEVSNDHSFEPEFVLAENAAFADFVRPETLPKQVSSPFLGDISAGKNTYVYDAHTYHTKVPPAGIRLLIEHFTDPGGTVLDPFCGSGMTGVAALEAGRNVLVSDLSPAAAFIAFNHSTPIDHRRFLTAVRSLLDHASTLEDQLYTTECRRCHARARILYTVWSFGLRCSTCHQEFRLWDVARDERPSVRESKIRSEFDCPHCGVHLSKRGLQRTQRYPVQVGYTCCAGGPKEQTAELNAEDHALLDWIDNTGVPEHLWFPRDSFPPGVNTRQAIAAGIISVDRAYTTRALWSLAALWDAAGRWPEPDVRAKLLFALTSLYQRVTVFSEFRFWGGSGNTANYNVPAIMNEQNVFRTFERKARTISWYFREAPPRTSKLRVSVHSALHHTQLPSESVDYIFTDPPFGGNINYSEMNFLWESWLRTKTEPSEEAIINRVQQKGIEEYEDLLAGAFGEAHRVLKQGAWLTVVFHNSSASVWRALQNAVKRGGFEVKGTQTFDKQHGTFKQFVSDNAVGYDLVLHCQKSEQPTSSLAAATDDVAANVKAFVASQLRGHKKRYSVEYLHVDRPTEFDYRRLFAEWLMDIVNRSDVVAISFEEFRAIVDAVREDGESA